MFHVTGSSGVINGVYIATSKESCGFSIFRKSETNMGILKWTDGKWYICDCGRELTPAGVDHLDFFSAVFEQPNNAYTVKSWEKEEDAGDHPMPVVKWISEKDRRRYALDLPEDQESLIDAVYIFPTKSRFIKLIEILARSNSYDLCYKFLSLLGDHLKSAQTATEQLTQSDRQNLSRMCAMAKKPGNSSVIEMTEILANPNLHFYVEYLIVLATELKQRMNTDLINTEKYFNPKNLELLDQIVFARRQFRENDGLEAAQCLGKLYREIEFYTFDDRDCSTCRTKLFSLTDYLRVCASDGRLDSEGRDATFKTFWESGLKTEKEVVDEAEVKDNDPEKEQKCPIIKDALEVDIELEKETEKIHAYRKELLSRPMSLGVVDLEFLSRHDCHNTELKLISIHAVVWDVTHNLEKYAPDGEYNFWPGKDITYPLGVSSLSDKFANQFYKLTPLMLKKAYGWMEYFDKKYTVVGRLKEYEKEDEFPDPPKEDPEMECSIM
jgi:hypothetical protein